MNVEPALGRCPDCGGGIVPDGKWGRCVKCRQRLGDCYGVALRYVFRHDGWTLVHGTLLNAKGERIYHAWAEKNDTVWSGQLGRAKAMPRAKWHRFVESVEAWYDRPLAVALYQVTQKWGPWRDEDVKRARALLDELKAKGLGFTVMVGSKEYRVEP